MKNNKLRGIWQINGKCRPNFQMNIRLNTTNHWVNQAWCLVVYQAKLGALKFRLLQPINGEVQVIPLIYWYCQLRQRYKLHLQLKLVQLLQDFRQMFLISVVWIVISPFIWLTTSHLISQRKPILYSFQKRVPLPYLLRDFPHQRLIISRLSSRTRLDCLMVMPFRLILPISGS